MKYFVSFLRLLSFFFSAGFLVLLLSGSTAHAQTIYGQQIDTSSLFYTSPDWPLTRIDLGYPNTTSPTGDRILKLKIKNVSGAPITGWGDWAIFLGGGGGNANCLYNAIKEPIASIPTDYDGFIYLDRENCSKTLGIAEIWDSAGFYELGLGFYNTYTGAVQFYGNSSGVPFYEMLGNDAFVPDGITVEITDPQMGNYSDFQFWNVHAENLATSTTYQIRVDYTQNTFPNYYDTLTYTTPSDITSVTFGILKSRPLASYATTTWSAYPTITLGTTTTQGATITFNIFANSSILPPTTTSTVGDLSVNCGEGFWSGTFCEVMAFLFVPSEDSMNRFTDIWAPISKKPPMGYFTSLNSALGEANSTNTERLIDASTTEAFSGIFAPIRTAFGWIIVLVAGVFIYKSISKLEL